MFLRRLLFEPIGNGGGGSALSSSQVPAPAPSSTPEPAAPAYGSPERTQVSPSASNNQPRDFNFHNLDVSGDPAPTQATGQPQQRQAPAPTDPNLAPGQTRQPAQQWQSIRDAAGLYGYRFGPDVQSDADALRHLIHQVQQRDYHAQLGQRLAPHANDIQGYLAQRQGQPQQQAAPERQPWEAPPFNRQWLSLVEQDPASGLYLSRAGVDPSVGQRVQDFVEWKQKFDENPAAVLNDMVTAKAQEAAQTIIQRQFQEQSTQSAARDIVRQNSGWFYAKDQTGNPVYDFKGNATPSPAGVSYLRHLNTVRSYGVTDPRAQDALAKQAMQAEWYAASVRQQPPPPVAAGNTAAHTNSTNPMAALSPQSRAASAADTPDDGINDVQQLKAALKRKVQAAGITDEDMIRQHVFNGE